MFKFLGFLLFLALLVGGYGLYADWFSISKTTHAGETRFEVGVNRDELGKDMRGLQDKFGDLVDKIGADEAVTGTIVRVNKDKRRIVLDSGGEERKLTLVAGATIEVDGAKAKLGALRAGDEVMAQLAEKGSDKATKVVVRR